MPRRLRVATGGYAYHVLNRGVGGMRLFAKERDFEAFEEIIGQAKERLPMRVLAWLCLSATPIGSSAPRSSEASNRRFALAVAPGLLHQNQSKDSRPFTLFPFYPLRSANVL